MNRLFKIPSCGGIAGLLFLILNATVFGDEIATIAGRADFVVQNPEFAKVLLSEINGARFRLKLARWTHLSFKVVKVPTTELTYTPDNSLLYKFGGSYSFSLKDPSNKLVIEHLEKIADKTNQYIILRLQGKEPSYAESLIFRKESKTKDGAPAESPEPPESDYPPGVTPMPKVRLPGL